MHRLAQLFGKLRLFIQFPRSLGAFLSWSKFSFTSYEMVSLLRVQGILPKTVLDVGANVGQFAIACSHLLPGVVVHSFEPLPECVTSLKKNTHRLSNILVYPLALGDRQGEITINLNQHSLSSSVLPLGEHHLSAFPGARAIGAIVVPVTTLDIVFKGIQFDSPVLLKLDVQGYEATTLKGAKETLSRVDYVILETSFTPMYVGESVFHDMVYMMEERGFTFLKPVGFLVSPQTGEILQMDALFGKDHSVA